MTPHSIFRGVPGLSPPRAAGLAGLWLLLVVLFTPQAIAQNPAKPPSAPEPVLKAALLMKILPFIQWPTNTFANTNDPMVIVVIDAAEIHDQLRKYAASQSIAGHPVVVHRSLADTDRIHVLFVGREHRRGLDDLIPSIADRPVLTVGEQTGFAEGGGIVNILVKDQRPSLEISREAASRVGIRFNSNLALLKSIHWIRGSDPK
jgi:YfiR/HmsC-like